MNLRRRKLSKNFPLRRHEFTSSDASQHKLSFCIEGAIFYQDCCGISVTINKWLDYLESLTADIRGVGRDWWTWGEWERGESFISDASSSWTDYCGAVFNFVLVVNSRNERDDAEMRWCNRGVWVWASHFLNQSWPHHRRVILFHTMFLI